jgi:hypothetical protein
MMLSSLDCNCKPHILEIRVQQSAQRLAGSVQARFDDPRTRLQHPRRFFRVQSFDVAQEQNGSVSIRQLPDAAPHQLARLLPLEGGFRGLLPWRGGIDLVLALGEMGQQLRDKQRTIKMRKIIAVIAAFVVSFGLSLALVGCGSSTPPSQPKMGGDKMGEKMQGDKMQGDKMQGDKMGGKMGGKMEGDKMQGDKKDKMDDKK